jgi:cytochrome d ubiquinol oxidase subunit II
VILGLGVFIYVTLDGFDLGVGMLHGLVREEQRDTLMHAIGPFWDGNETWLILGGVGLLAAFPLAFAIIIPAVYFPIMLMLLALVFRGVAFEFRWRDSAHQGYWDAAFAMGSLIATFAQGITVGAVIQGIHVEDNAYAGGWLDWLSPFTLLTGVSLVLGYALLGATWLVWKTDGGAQSHARRMAFFLGLATLAAMAAVSAATPFLTYDYWRRWFTVPSVLLTAQVPLLVIIDAIIYFWSLKRGAERLPFLMVLALFMLGFIGLGISIYPYLVPRAITLWQAAAPAQSQEFMLVGTAVIFPIIIGYTAWAYWVFRGKAGTHGYH